MTVTTPLAQAATTAAATAHTGATAWAARIEHVSKSFPGPAGQQLVLDDISLDIAPGEFI
ncbi:ABC transporter ATP-binding protein, partial [Streptomyces sp. AGS-58]